jgi:hypothetical protein
VPTYGFIYALEIGHCQFAGKLIGIMSKGASSEHAVISLLQRHNYNPART